MERRRFLIAFPASRRFARRVRLPLHAAEYATEFAGVESS